MVSPPPALAPTLQWRASAPRTASLLWRPCSRAAGPACLKSLLSSSHWPTRATTEIATAATAATLCNKTACESPKILEHLHPPPPPPPPPPSRIHVWIARADTALADFHPLPYYCWPRQCHVEARQNRVGARQCRPRFGSRFGALSSRSHFKRVELVRLFGKYHCVFEFGVAGGQRIPHRQHLSTVRTCRKDCGRAEIYMY